LTEEWGGGVVEYDVGAERFAESDVAAGAGDGDVCAEEFGDLDGECSDSAGAAVDEDSVAGFDIGDLLDVVR
jgi:hypothetical protein